MVQSEIYYMITINQSPECEVPLEAVEAGLLKYAQKYSNRYLLAQETGKLNGKAHFHLSVELLKETRKDNISRAIQSHTKVLKTKNSIDIRGTRKVPHQESWEIYAIDYVAKDYEYKTNIDETWIKQQIENRKLKDIVEQRSIYVDRPKFYKLYREELIKRQQQMKEKHYRGYDFKELFHQIMSDLLAVYTPLWLKPNVAIHVIHFQENQTEYYEYLHKICEQQFLLLTDPAQIELVRK